MKRKDIDLEESLTDEQRAKLKDFHALNHERIELWRSDHGHAKLPVYWDDKIKRWFWGGRNYRRALQRR